MIIALLRRTLINTRWLHVDWPDVYSPVIDVKTYKYAVAFGFRVTKVDSLGIEMRGDLRSHPLTDGQPLPSRREVLVSLPWVSVLTKLTSAPQPIHARVEMPSGVVYLESRSQESK